MRRPVRRSTACWRGPRRRRPELRPSSPDRIARTHMDLGLKGKVAMVGGASKGLGFAVAKALAAEGAIVSIASRDEAAIQAAAATLGGQTFGMAVDVKSAADIQKWAAATIEKFGGVDLLLCNGGGPPAGPSLSFDDAAWQDA